MIEEVEEYALIKQSKSGPSKEQNSHNTDGSKTDFYDIGSCKDLDDLAEHLELLSDEFNAVKAIFGIAKERKGSTRHSVTNGTKDAKKLLHYAQRIEKRLIK